MSEAVAAVVHRGEQVEEVSPRVWRQVRAQRAGQVRHPGDGLVTVLLVQLHVLTHIPGHSQL